MKAKRGTRILLSWFLVFLCAAAILLIVPFARTIQNFVSAHWGHSFFPIFVMVVVGAAFLTLLFFLFFRLKIRRLSNYLWLLLVAALYFYFTLKLSQVPVEAVHFLEYGLLGFLLFRALKFNTKDISIYFIAFLSGSLVGIFDEIFQWVVPVRYWDIRDVGLNSLSCALFLAAMGKGIQPHGISARIKPKSFKTFSLLLAGNMVLVGLCLSNTPSRVAAYTKIFPGLSPLQNEEAMNRFRKKHQHPEIGEFYSLLSSDELRREDREKLEQNAQDIKNWKKRDFKEFKRRFSALNHPFLYEMRSHLEIRDKNYEKALRSEDKEAKKKFFLAAYRENLILEKYFGRTLHESSCGWDEEQRKKAGDFINKNTPYSSPLRFGLFSRSEKTMWLFISGSMLLLAALNFLLFRG
ncbi:MAG: VanZ family protein [Candidatus Aminicenantes bacterium]